MDDLIVAAIKEKRILSFAYNGHARIAEPHIYGISDGVHQLLGYQIRGSSSSGIFQNGDVSKYQRCKIYK